jgi:hypothetical protein
VFISGWLEKVRQLGTSLPQKQTLRLVLQSIAVVYLMKAMLGFAWAVPQGDDMAVVIE